MKTACSWIKNKQTLGTFVCGLFLYGCDTPKDPDAGKLPPKTETMLEPARINKKKKLENIHFESTLNINNLRNANHTKVLELIGNPLFVRLDPPSVYWRYGDNKCALDIYLMRTDATSELVVQHLNFRVNESKPRVPLNCRQYLQGKLFMKETGGS